MANTIPCPNPVCTHNFGLAELQSAAQLACPKCGFKIQGKGPAQPKPVAKPVAKPSVKPAVAVPKVAAATPVQMKSAAPVAPATPVAAGPPPAAAPVSSEGSISDGTFFNPGVAAAGPLVRAKSAEKKPFNWLRLLLVLFGVGFALCIVVIILVLTFPSWRRSIQYFAKNDPTLEGETYVGKIINSSDQKESVYRLVLPSTEWAYDGELTSRFSGLPDRSTLVTAWRDTTGYDFWFAVIVKDHGPHKPRDAEMVRTAVDKLEAHFGIDLEVDIKPEAAKFGAHAARKLKFRGVYMDAKWEGECWMLFNNGIAYWLILAAPARVDVERFAEQLPQKHVTVVSSRQGWREQPWPEETFYSSDKKFELRAPKGVWEQTKDPTASEGPNARLLLGGRYLRLKDNKKNAIMVVYHLDKQNDQKAALKLAREQLEAREKESNDKYKVVHAPEIVPGQTEAGETERSLGKNGGRLIDLKLVNPEEKEPYRYYLLAVITEPEATYALLCECSWASRDIWRQDFLDVMGTMRAK